MASILYRFSNTDFGGNVSFTLTEDQMPNYYPIAQDVRQNSHIGDSGKLWQYTWYRKHTYRMQFESVGTNIAASFATLVNENVAFLWYQDVNAGTDGGTGTYTYTGGFTYEPFGPDLVNFSFTIREG